MMKGANIGEREQPRRGKRKGEYDVMDGCVRETAGQIGMWEEYTTGSSRQGKRKTQRAAGGMSVMRNRQVMRGDMERAGTSTGGQGGEDLSDQETTNKRKASHRYREWHRARSIGRRLA